MMKKTLILAAVAALSLPITANAERTGEELYNTKCGVCHAQGVAGAPMFGNAEEWAPRVAKGMDALLASAQNGLNAMPPMGMCMDCTDDEMAGAVQYMLDAVK